MITAEYTIPEIKKILANMSKMYDLARVVDPQECRILEFTDDSRINMCEKCYNVWNSELRCVNCSSASACKTGRHKEKLERFDNKIFSIQSNPIRLKLSDGTAYDAVLELISIHPDTDDVQFRPANNREAENINNNAAQFHASHDSLTRVLNSDAFFQYARAILVKDPDITWVMIVSNIKDFRMVNDQFGVTKGNDLLVCCAEQLQKASDVTGGICARLSADQFALLMPKPNYQESVLSDIADALSDFVINDFFTLRIHFGVYEIKDASLPISVMCDRANAALKSIKNNARTLVAYYDDQLLQTALFEQKMISSFGTMLKNGNFKMYLQPLSHADGTPFGAEALVRCILPDGTVIAPARFIETFEQAGIIQELDTYIWELAVRQLSEWKNTDKKDLIISVNISAKDFYNIDIYTVLMDLIAKYDIDIQKLHLEMTETALIDDSEKVAETLQKLREAGFFIEIDDFGKGYSSLSMLKDIHADMLKIDMGFLRETKNKHRSDIILEAVIEMAESLEMDVITEGVETKEQLNMLSSMGCHNFQGFYFSPPVPPEEFNNLCQ